MPINITYTSGVSAQGLPEFTIPVKIAANSTVLANEEVWGPVQNSMQVSALSVLAAVAGSTSTALALGKCTGSNAVGSAIPLMSGVVVISGQDWSTQPALIASAALLTLIPGDRLAAIKTGIWQPATSVLMDIQMVQLS